MGPRFRQCAAVAQRFACDKSGATAVEYAVLLFVVFAIALAVAELGGAVGELYASIAALFG